MQRKYDIKIEEIDEKLIPLDDEENDPTQSSPHLQREEGDGNLTALDPSGEEFEEGDDEGATGDPYKKREETPEKQTSVRSIVVGGMLGAFISAGAMYVSFKSGQGVSSSLFCAITGFAIMKPLSNKLPLRYGGGYFGPKENASLQTSGTAASGLSAGFTVAIPVLYWINYLKAPLSNDIGSLIFWTLAAGYYGLFFAVPLRHMTIIKQKLRFPTGTATANVIQALHASQDESTQGRRKAFSLLLFFSIAFCWTLFTHFFPFLYNLPIFYYMYLSSSKTAVWALAASHWRWALNFSPAMFGGGMMMGINVALSMLFGGVLCWGVIGPILINVGWADDKYGYQGDFVQYPSAQYWLLWPGISIMLIGSFFELIWNWRIIWEGLCSAWVELKEFGSLVLKKIKKDTSVHENDPLNEKKKEEDEDPAPLEQRVPFLWWSSGLVVSSILTGIVLIGFWDILWYEVILAIVLSFLLSFMACQVFGETDNNPQGTGAKATQFDNNPQGTVAKATQFVFAGFNPSQAVNVICGNISLCGAGQAGEMLQDMKTDMAGASPRAMFWAQIWGSMFGVFSNVAAFCLIASAYPCLMELPTHEKVCNFNMPAAQSWFGVSYALTHGFLNAIPKSSAWASLIFSIITIIICTLRKYISEEYKIYVPSPLAFGMAFTFPSPNLIFMIGCGGVFMKIWERYFNGSFEKYGYTTAAGLMTGEGIAGLMQAVLVISGLTWTSSFGLEPPFNSTNTTNTTF